MLSFLIVAAIAIAVIIGYKTGFKTGFFAIIFAYLIGCFGMGMSTKEVIGGWPVSTMFVIFSVSLFYNFALVNGTLEKASRQWRRNTSSLARFRPHTATRQPSSK